MQELTITIARDDDESVYRQIARQIRNAIASGAVRPSDSLPAVRRLASDLGVNLNTVARAYRMLEEEGFVHTERRSRVSVAAPGDAPARQSPNDMLPDLRAILLRLRQTGLNRRELQSMVSREIDAVTGQ